MYSDEYEASARGAAAKVRLLRKNPRGYLMLSLFGGAYLGIGVLLTYVIAGYLSPSPAAHIVMGASFGVALSLVIIAGSEMFTGNAFVLYNGLREKTVSVGDVLGLLIFCYIGNWLGALILSFSFWAAGLDTGNTAAALVQAAAVKMSLPPAEIFFRGMLCNMLVCLAVWCSFRCHSDAGKMIMIFWCLYVFYTIGFEHCIANMTLMDLALAVPHPAAVSLTGYAYNLFWATLGNLAGAVFFVSIPYGIATKKV
ncbi:formate/nitrite transporter family protein [Megasphaera sp.]|uniref:formate/nitrite transporter family protein n=1 Tax=Megasphaera sp. TaxID=2023260 RepID=UPI00351FFE61